MAKVSPSQQRLGTVVSVPTPPATSSGISGPSSLPDRWVRVSKCNMPKDAFVGGHSLREPFYIGRLRLNKKWTPGKVLDSANAIYVPYNTVEIVSQNFEVLCLDKIDQYKWVQTTADRVPLNAVIGGTAAKNNDCIFIGRRMHNGELTPGYIEHCVGLFICYMGRVYKYREFEVLINGDQPVFPDGACPGRSE